MALNSQFSLSIELTKLLPLGPLLSSTGRGFLSLARDLQNSGSNIVVEADLANVFGRNRIEPRFESSFRTAVKESCTQRLNGFLDIVLESGAGPTVRRSLKDQAYFSTVVQLSLLTSMLDIQTLATGIYHVFARRAEAISTEPYACPSYDSLFGTLQAIRDQTSAFNWNLISDAVTSSFGQGFEKNVARNSADLRFSWVVPTALLQGCLDFFTMVQHFPDERILQIKTGSCYTEHKLHRLLIIWAHHVLGLTVALCLEDGKVIRRFGGAYENVIIVAHDYLYESEICLLDGTRQDLFRISESLDDPQIIADDRTKAEGFGTRCLAGSEEHSQQIIQKVLEYCKTWFGESYTPSYFDRLQKTGQFLFGDSFDSMQINGLQTRNSLPHHYDEDIVLPLARAVYAFTHVENLDGLQDLPITLRALRVLDRKSISNGREAFEYMVRLVLGNHDMRNPILVSCRGWSIYTNILTLPDPTDLSAPLIHVSLGVPSRAGERKQFIIDGVSPRRVATPDVDFSPTSTSPNAKLFSNFDVPKPCWLVGTSNLAFEIVIRFELEPQHRTVSHGGRSSCRMMFKAGLVELEALALQASKIPPCYHTEALIGSEFTVPSGCRVFSSSLFFGNLREATSSTTFISLSAGSPSARWFCLLLAAQERQRDEQQKAQLLSEHIYIRDENGCPRCCIKYVEDRIKETNRGDSIEPALAVLVL
jgi:hypothetical protein